MDPTDARWDIFYELERYLKTTFPLLCVLVLADVLIDLSHKTMKSEKVNTHGLLYTWQGSKPDLKPIVSRHFSRPATLINVDINGPPRWQVAP